MTPTQRSLKKLRSEGWLVAVTEHWNGFAHIRQDLFGFGDLLAIKGDEIIAVQTTSGTNVAARLSKIRTNASAALWLTSPYRKIVIHGWSKRAPHGKRKTWQCREVLLLANGQPSIPSSQPSVAAAAGGAT
jgi:hypothetical protein